MCIGYWHFECVCVFEVQLIKRSFSCVNELCGLSVSEQGIVHDIVHAVLFLKLESTLISYKKRYYCSFLNIACPSCLPNKSKWHRPNRLWNI